MASNPNYRIPELGWSLSPYDACVRLLSTDLDGAYGWRIIDIPGKWLRAKPVDINGELYLTDFTGPWSWEQLQILYGAVWE